MVNIILLGITSLLTDISSEMVYPLLPIYLVSKLGASPAILGLIEGIAESTASLTKVFFGYFSDRFKKRKLFAILGYSLSTWGKFFLYLSASWNMVFLARFLDRLGKGVRVAARDALIAESSPEKKRGLSFGIHRSLDTLGAVIGIILAIYFMQYYKGDFKKVFLLSLIPAVLGVFVLFKVKESPVSLMAKNSIAHLFPWLRDFKSLDKRLKFFLLISFLFTLGNSSNQFLILRAKNLGFSLINVILMYLVYNITYCLSSYPAGKVSDRIGRKKILVIGYLFYGLVYLGFALTGFSLWVWFLFVVYGFYMGFTEGVEKAFISDMAPVERRATLIGLNATLVGVALFPASLLAGILWKFMGAAAPFWFGGVMGILASIGLAVFL